MTATEKDLGSPAGRGATGGAGAALEQPFTEDQSRHFIASLQAVAAADGAIKQEELDEIAAIAGELGFSSLEQ